MTAPTPAQDLTALADKLDELAMKATPGEWRTKNLEPRTLGVDWIDGAEDQSGNHWSSIASFGTLSFIKDRIPTHAPDGMTGANAALVVALRNALPQITTALREAARLREALEPFAAEAATYDADDDTDTDKLVSDQKMLIIESIDGTLSDSLISVGDFRRARAALESPHGA